MEPLVVARPISKERVLLALASDGHIGVVPVVGDAGSVPCDRSRARLRDAVDAYLVVAIPFFQFGGVIAGSVGVSVGIIGPRFAATPGCPRSSPATRRLRDVDVLVIFAPPIQVTMKGDDFIIDERTRVLLADQFGHHVGDLAVQLIQLIIA